VNGESTSSSSRFKLKGKRQILKQQRGMRDKVKVLERIVEMRMTQNVHGTNRLREEVTDNFRNINERVKPKFDH
jgi:hypothetical protein